jgi:hypothetical protein
MSACDTFMADKLDLTVSTTRVNRSSPSGSTEDNSIECFPAAHTQIKTIRQQILDGSQSPLASINNARFDTRTLTVSQQMPPPLWQTTLRL